MAQYDLSHLTQNNNQAVMGPIQDDEALLLYSLIRVMRLKNIVEIGGLGGYSATNFLKAIKNNGKVITIDLHPTPKINNQHIVIVNDAKKIVPKELPINSIDLLFFDAHDFEAQMHFFDTMSKANLVTKKTILALHDTGTHPEKYVEWAYKTEQGYVHQKVERKMVNKFFSMGYQPICFHTDVNTHDEELPYRHGITLLSIFDKLTF